MNIDFIIPSFHSFDLTDICIRGFEKFRPEYVRARYIVIENSSDISYKHKIKSISDNVVWENNDTNLRGSEANADAIAKALPFVESDFVFFSHCDTFIPSSSFYFYMKQLLQEYSMIGTSKDNIRINACHISGIMASSNVLPLQKLDFYPVYHDNIQVMDVGDILTHYCRENGIPYYCCQNSVNNDSLRFSEPYDKFRVDRCLYNDEVIYLHLGRGIPKTNGTYSKHNRIGLKEWKDFCFKRLQ